MSSLLNLSINERGGGAAAPSAPPPLATSLLLAGDVSRVLLDGLLHWLVCRSAVADEPLSSASISVILTPKQLVLEMLAKMSVLEANVNCIMRSPDKGGPAHKSLRVLSEIILHKTNEVTREFA